MDLFVALLKYGFVLALTVEAGMIGAALWRLALDKARPPAPTGADAPPVEEPA